MTKLKSPASVGGLACSFRSGALGAEASDPIGQLFGDRRWRRLSAAQYRLLAAVLKVAE